MALRVLTPDVAEKIVEMCNKLSLKVEISIKNSKMFIRLYTDGLFEPAIGDFNREIENIYIYKHILITTREIISELIKVLNELEV